MAQFNCVHTHARLRSTNDPSIDTFRVEFLVGPAFVLGLLFNYSYSITEISWSFSIFLEAVAILPQLLSSSAQAKQKQLRTHYLAALGAYCGLYIPNRIYRCVIVNTHCFVRVYIWYIQLLTCTCGGYVLHQPQTRPYLSDPRTASLIILFQ